MPVRLLVESFYYQLWNRVDLSIASEILHPAVSFRGSVGLAAVGRAEVCDYVTMVTTALSDYRCDVEALIAEGPKAAPKVRFSGLHRGDFLGHPPTDDHRWLAAVRSSTSSVADRGDVHCVHAGWVGARGLAGG